MSTNIQQYSVPAQQAAIRAYAAEHGMAIIRSYVDAGKSGLLLRDREALLALLTDVQQGDTDFDVILVYDISRWGRFQDVDEGAYYEYLCRKANIRVEYCAEPFTNDGGPLAALLKSIKRAMAAEYSREQSTRVRRGISRTIARGHFGGGSPGFGFRRMLVGPNGEEKGLLRRGEIRGIRQDHIILVPAPAAEVKAVRRIFRLFVQRNLSPQRIANLLNSANVCGRRWRDSGVRQILQNERYIGTSVYNRYSQTLRGPRIRNAPDHWVRVPGAYEPIISAELFAAAQTRLEIRGHRKYTEQQLLDRLRYLLAKHGYLSASLIDRDAHPMYPTYYRCFGGMLPAYERIGYALQHRRRDIDRWHSSRATMIRLADKLVAALKAEGVGASRDGAKRVVEVEGQPRLVILIASYVPTAARRFPCWRVANMRTGGPALTLLVRMNGTNSEPLDLYLLPRPFAKGRQVRLREEAFAALRSYRCEGVEDLLVQVTRALAPRGPVAGKCSLRL